MKLERLGKLAVPFLLATIGVSGIAISSRITGMIDASPEFYSLYKMSFWEVVSFVVVLCIVVPILLGLLAYAMARVRYLRPLLPIYCVALSTVALTGLVRAWPAPAGGWLLIALCLICAVVGFFAFTRIAILRVFLMATALGLPVATYNSISVASAESGQPAAVDVPRLVRTDPGKPLPNILFIILDELPLTTLLNAEGDIDQVRFPNIHELAHNAYWFANAGSVSCNTPTAVPGILTGQLFGSPPKSVPPDFKSHPVNLFSLLKTDYHLQVVQNLTQMCPPGTCNSGGPAFYKRKFFYEHLGVAWLDASLPKGFEAKLPNLDQYWMEAGAAATKLDPRKRYSIRVNQIKHFIETIGKPADKPRLDFAHFLLPHTPFDLLPNGQQYFDGFTTYAITGSSWDDDQPRHVLQSYFRHILQSGYSDEVVGEIVAKLKAQGLYDDTIIVIVADHGVSFVPGDTRRITNKKNFANLMGVPMIIKAAHQDDGIRIDAPAQTIDILPTLLGLAGLQVENNRFQGRDLLNSSSPPLEKRSNFCSGHDYKSFELELEEPMRHEVAVRNSIFGEYKDGPLEMGYSPKPDWIGKPISSLGELEDGKGTADLGHVFGKSRDGLVPIYLNGVIDGSPISDDHLLLVATLNDKIAAVMPPVRARNGKTNVVSIMLQPALLNEGANTIALYALDKTLAGSPRFMSLNISDIESGETAKAIKFDYQENE